ncbi:MAG: tyrosine-type recombinase/integrase [Acidobacteria bacterium]|nr:tyrosine-type recombinase/integrase [Acidobacteriota bacterium]MYH30698.1 tyrosine-type recombinase/integrase [Acidobacteriota bacterium]MYK87376.1 tyrosine-type recombinase/integrase [Acidobacteriota bacterium]
MRSGASTYASGPPRSFSSSERAARSEWFPLWTRTSRCLRQWFDEEGEAASDYAFRNARGDRLTRQGVTHLLDQACQRVRDRCRSLNTKRVSPHVVRHTTAMHLLQAGVDIATIALWLGHERLETTHQYVEADLQFSMPWHGPQARAIFRLRTPSTAHRGLRRTRTMWLD